MFDALAGNERVKELLRRMLAAGRLPGALLFTGEEGIGKKLFALEIARALSCRTPRDGEGCGECPPCKRIGRFNFPQSAESDDWKGVIWTDHPDVGMVVAPKRLLLVDQMRYIEREANYRPFEGRARVFLVEDADKLNDPSANALLKVLEETPHTSHIILLTSRPAMLLPTIRSRCQVIRFSPLTADEIEKHLVENQLATKDEAPIRARVARGSLGRAVNQDLEEYTEQRESMLKVLSALAGADPTTQLLRASQELNEPGYKEEFETRLDVLETLIRDAWMLSLDAPASGVVNADLLPELKQISKRIDRHRPGHWISRIEEMREQLVVNLNRKAATDSLYLSMASNPSLVPKRRFVIKKA